MEGVTDTVSPKIVAAHNVEEIDERLDGTVFAISGKIANELTEYKGIPVISALTDVDKLVDLIEEKVFERLPEFPWECCAACGYSCEELSERILKGQSLREDCVIAKVIFN